MKKIIKIFEKLIVILFRNRIILMMINYPAKKNRVNLNWAPICKWSKSGFTSRKLDTVTQNFGDYLAIPIYEYMTKKYGLDPDKRIVRTVHLYTIGSLILMGYQDATIWGSGILHSEPDGMIWRQSKYRKLDIRCVRGPETLRRLAENGYDVSNCKIGDPGLLLPLIYIPKKYDEEKDYSVILHMNLKDEKIDNQIDILTNDWQRTIDQIYNSKLIISSSLHGIIIAEAYGIPAVLLGKIEGGDLFKYRDYYYSTGRKEFPVCASVEEALKTTPAPLPDIVLLQQNLLDSFPKDLWQ